jgi:hypothetical protein
LIIGLVFSKKLKRSRIMNNTTRHSINEIGSREDGLIPKSFGHRGLSEKAKSGFNKMAVFTFDGTVLLMGVRTRHSMLNANLLKILVKFVVLPTPIGLNALDFSAKLSFNTVLKLIKDVFHV